MTRSRGKGEKVRPPSGPLLRALTFAVVDVETTGGGAHKGHRITELAVVPVEDGVLGRPFSTLVNPERDIPPIVQRITGITEDMVAQAPCFADVAPQVAPLLSGRLFTAHNVRFDWGFVAAEMSAAACPLPSDTPQLCTVRMGRALFPGLPSYSLGPLSEAMAVRNRARHRALGDALATAEILLHLLGRAEDRGIRHLDELEAWVRQWGGVGRRKTPPPAVPESAVPESAAPVSDARIHPS